MKTWQIFVVALLITAGLNAQSEETLFGNSGLRLSGAWGSAAYNFSSFNNDDWTLIRGGYGGLEFSRDVLIGWGGYRTKERVTGAEGTSDFNLRYHGPVVGIAPGSTRAIHPRFTFIAGTGKVWTNTETARDKVFVFQPSAGVEFNVFQWFRLGFEGGYRFVGASDRYDLSSGDLSAPFAQIELRFGLSWGR